MEDNSVKKTVKKDRFEFILKINNNIVCQRYFKINNVDESKLNYENVRDAVEYAVALIDNDLKSKSRVYMWYNIPKQEVKTMEYIDENNEKKAKRYIETTYDNNDIPSDLQNIEPEWSNVLSFEFLVDGVPIMGKKWSAHVYPPFVRNFIDLTNKIYKFENTNPSIMDYNFAMLKTMCSDKEDLVPIIIEEFCNACSK